MAKKRDLTQTTEFDVEEAEEAASADASLPPPHPPGKWKPKVLPKLQVEQPPELRRFEPKATVWVMERRARGMRAAFQRWLRGRGRKK